MMRRDPVTRNIVITPEDLPAMAGLVLSKRDDLLKDEAKIPGSLKHLFDQFIDAANRFEKCLDSDAGLT
jgi:hypothetical protein